ncbi:MAG TPA: alpha/beta hydrolase-fold protein [Thermoanaerobaculia bacterium]|nr:alpha/beta hydrolase-fold protein [Thermoanaerobaculia bacterium]
MDFLLRRAGGQRFRLYVPPHYDDSGSWPAVLFLHGAGERGSDSVAPVKVGMGPALEKRAEPYPAIVVFPQCPRDAYWSLPSARASATIALEETIGEFNIDMNRIALTGISMGAAGAWLVAADAPQRFMSLAPICGWVYADELLAFARRIAHIPTWMFHGDADNIVPVESSRAMVAALRQAGADVRYTELRDVAHNSWDAAYQRTEVLDWLIDPTPTSADR